MTALEDTIAAISSPLGEGAVSLIRLSGPAARAIAGRVFHGRQPVDLLAPRVQHFGSIHEGARKIDDVLLTVFTGPASYTGEDVVEITGHGGMLVTRRLLEVLLAHGARAAGPGEFTQRAFLHGKLDLTQAEAVMDLISAQSELAMQAAHEQLAGGLGRRVTALQDAVLELLAHVEAFIDFPDEDIDPETGEALLARLARLRADIDALLATAERGRILREGLRTVIYGAPNVGKSSLLNLLLGYDRAMVSSTPGTTRDTIEEVITVRGYALRLVDTAGVRFSEDAIEQAGIERTRRELKRAELVLHVHDATSKCGDRAEGVARGELLVLNKVDLGEHPTWAGVEAVRFSCLTGLGTIELEEAIERKIAGGDSARRDWSVAINARHQAHLLEANGFLLAAESGLRASISPEFVAEELRAALAALGEIVGRVETEDLLGKIFSTFCIGK